MKNNKLRDKPYKKFIYRIFFQTLAMISVAVVMVLVLRSLSRGKIGNIITKFISEKKGISFSEASKIYWLEVGSNLQIILFISIIIIFLIGFRLLLSWFTKYFDEIIAGVNSLASGKEIVKMSPELDFMYNKLSDVKGELERSREAEREAEQRKNDLIVYLAHDIKTPLTSVIGYLSLLDENIDLSIEQKAKYTSITLGKAYRLENLINEFFEITRYNLSSVPLKKEELDLCCMMAQITEELYPQIIENNKEVILDIPDDFSVLGDSEKLARVFNNILKNAISYSDEISEIKVIGKKYDDRIELTFRNKGSIPSEKINSIFDKFYRADEARQTSTGGSGLGLAIAKDIILLHKGQIIAKSEEGYIEISVVLPI